MVEARADDEALRSAALAVLARSFWPVLLVDEQHMIVSASEPAQALLGTDLAGRALSSLIVRNAGKLNRVIEQTTSDSISSFGMVVLRKAGLGMVTAEVEVRRVAGIAPWRTLTLYPLSRAERRAQMLLMANRFAPSMLSVLTQDSLYRLIGGALQELGLVGGVALLQPDGALQMEPSLDYGTETLAALPFGQMFTSIVRDLRPALSGPYFAHVLSTRSSLLVDDIVTVLGWTVSAEYYLELQQMQQMAARIGQIIAPLLAGDELRGVFILSGPGLSIEDIPVVEALTNQVTAALEQIELRAQMQAHIGRLELIIENVPDALLVVRPDMTISPLNDEPLRYVGYHHGELEGVAFTQLVPQRYHKELSERWEALQSGSKERFELELLRRDGSSFIGTITASRIPGSQDVLAIVTDVTARRRLFQAEKMAALGQLVAGVAHELNNPLAIILGTIQLNLQDDLPGAVIEDLRRIEQATLRAANIVQQLSTFVRPQGSIPQSIEMSWLIREVDRRLRGRAIESEVALTIDLDAEIPNVVGDPVLLRQVMLNVISNAIQAVERLPPGEPREVTVRSWFDGERVRVSISDTGPGIDAEHLARVFEPFFTTKTVGQGIGLGLAVAYAIVQQHSGTIWAESNPTRGTVFHIALPMTQEEDDHENTPSRDKGGMT